MLDEKLEDEVWITVVATGYDERRAPRRARSGPTRGREPAGEPRISRNHQRASGARPSTSTCRSSSRASDRHRAGRARRRRGRTSAHRRGRRGDPPRRRQRGGRGARRDADVVRRRAAADRARRRRLHARRRPGPGRRAAGLLRRGARATGERAPLVPVDVSFGDAVQVFNIGAASCGAYGDAGGRARGEPSATARSRWPSCARPRPRWRAPAWRSTPSRRTCSRSSRRSPSTRPSRARCSCPTAARVRAGEVHRDPELADALERLGAEGPAPFYTGDVARGGRPTGCASAAARSRRDGPRRLRGDRRASRCGSPTAAARCSPTRRRAPAARCSPTRWRCWSASRAPAGRGRARGARWSARRPSARRPSWTGSPSPGFLESLHGQPARLDHAHLGAGRRRLGVRGDVHQRRGLGRGRARHRHPRQQHDGRAGPLAAGLLHPPARAAAAVDDGPDGRARATGGPSSCSAPRAPTASARRCCR